MNVFVSNLTSSFSEDDLRKLFSPFGEVSSCKIITDRFSGLSKGFGFVEMLNSNEGMEAIERLNGQRVSAQPITVNVAKERTQAPGSNGRDFR